MTIRVGTRASALAVAQTQTVADRISAAAGVPVEIVRIESEGDRITASLSSLGGTGVFASALRDALLDGRCDAIVHSLKDLPVARVPGLRIGAVPGREDPRDALCARDGLTLATLPQGARVGTGSPRRRAALLAVRPDLDVVDIRGNIDTRLGRIHSDLDAVVLAAAGLTRIGRLAEASEIFDFEVSPQAPGQGALAVEVRDQSPSDPIELDEALAAIADPVALASVTAERALLGALEAGCAAPIGARGTVSIEPASGDGETAGDVRAFVGVVTVEGVVLQADGTRSLARTATEPFSGDSSDALQAAAERAGRLLADSLLSAGAAELAPLGATS